MRTFATWCADANTLRKLHGWLTIAWLVLAVLVTVGILPWQESIVFLVFVSIYANVVGHWSSWQAARTEVRQVEQEDA
jgi:hypothetical protein